MLAKRLIPCLDVRDGKIVKGVQFKHHQIVGDILERAEYYSAHGADELVFYDITASCDGHLINCEWIKQIAKRINIPFCVAGGIRTLRDAENILNAGADKISLNSPVLENPDLIQSFSETFGQQCVVIGIDSLKTGADYNVCQYTGRENNMRILPRLTTQWIQEVAVRGAGEIVLNCMNQDGMRQGYDIEQLTVMRQLTTLPLIASGGAGCLQDFLTVFQKANVDGALAASVFHTNSISIAALKHYLSTNAVEVRL